MINKIFLAKIPEYKSCYIHEQQIVPKGTVGKCKLSDEHKHWEHHGTEPMSEKLVDQIAAEEAQKYVGPWVQAIENSELWGGDFEIALEFVL